MRFTKVHLAALAFVVGVLPSAVLADGWFSRAGETKEVTLTDLLKNPRQYMDVEVEFKVYFDAPGSNYNPYFTRFNNDVYGNFSAWPIDARLYEKRDFPRPYPFFFASKISKEWKKVKNIDHMRIVKLTAVVRDVFRGQPWIEVLDYSSSSGGLSESDVKDVVRADACFVAGRYKDAARLYERADSSSLPDTVRADLQRRLGDSYFRMGEYGDAQDAYETGLRCCPDNAVLKQGAEAAEAARQRARAERRGQTVEGEMPRVAPQNEPVVQSNGVDEVIRLLEDPEKVQADVDAWHHELEVRAAALGVAPEATPVAGTEEPKTEQATETVPAPTPEATEPQAGTEPAPEATPEPTPEPAPAPEATPEPAQEPAPEATPAPEGCAEQPAQEPAKTEAPVETKPVEPTETAQPVEVKPAEQPAETTAPAQEPAQEPTAEQPEGTPEDGTKGCGEGATEEPAQGPEACSHETVEVPTEGASQDDERVVWVSGQMIRLPRLPFFGAEDVTDDDLRAIITDILEHPETDE
jgi:tetratricopeptide (TPR) repeat protein